ncbi:MAG: peptidyl-prolyl cis-trans isomerase [Phycisphaeraceae bacterium]|nr:peptidyl-prolyl cis-trans isomerase [Phycisphaeraceae bacterium]
MARYTLIIGILAFLLAGCQNTGSGPGDSAVSDGGFSDTPAGTQPAVEGSAAPVKITGKPAAYVNGQDVTWNEMQQALAEAAGGQVLIEEIVDRGINSRLHDRHLTVDDAMIETERRYLTGDLSDNADDAQRLINELRERRGLGESRWSHLLRRNAGLRLLVQTEGTGQVTEAALKDAFEFRYGPRYQARLIVTTTMPQAAEAIRRAKAGESFSDLAVELSTDSSRAQGGLLSPISPADPTYPAGVRSTIAQLAVGQISDPIALDRGFGVLKMERKIEGSNVKFDDVRGELTARVQRDIERIAMQQLARTIIAESQVVVLDPALQRSFAQQTRRAMQE